MERVQVGFYRPTWGPHWLDVEVREIDGELWAVGPHGLPGVLVEWVHVGWDWKEKA